MKHEIEERIQLIKNKKIPENYHKHNRELLPNDWEVTNIKKAMNIKNNYRNKMINIKKIKLGKYK